MGGKTPKICAVILNVGERAGLAACLRSLDAAGGGLEALVVHNGPRRAGFEEEVRAASAKVSEVIFTGSNLGFAAGNNIGIGRALAKGADYALLLNDDAVLAPGSVELLAAEGERNERTGMLGPAVLTRDGKRISFAGARFEPGTGSFSFPFADEPSGSVDGLAPFASDYVTGCALLVKRAAMEKAGLLDERFFLYWEDSDWGLRVKAAGFGISVVPAAKLLHEVSASSGGSHSPFRDYHFVRSHLGFAEKHAPSAKKRILAAALADAAWLLLKSGAEDKYPRARAHCAAIKDHFLGRSGPGPSWLRGTRKERPGAPGLEDDI